MWNVFATLHGKGSIDGIGGSVKHYVWTAVKTRKVIVNDAPSFVLACNAHESKVEVFKMSVADIIDASVMLLPLKAYCQFIISMSLIVQL